MTETKETNPYLKQENYFEGYQKSIDELKLKPEIVELDKLCYLVFMTEDGKKLMDQIVERYLLPGFISPHGKNAANGALYFEGFKEAFRMIRGSIKAHQQRIEAERLKE